MAVLHNPGMHIVSPLDFHWVCFTRNIRLISAVMVVALHLAIILPGCDAQGNEREIISQPAQPTKTARIMPLGDSITVLSRGSTYRSYLWQLALGKGYRIDLVGSQQDIFKGKPSTDFDIDHEGHPGWRADQVLAQIREWAIAAQPDFVLIHLGHNDLCQGQDIASTVGDLAVIIDRLRTVNPRVGIVLAQVIASSSSCHSQIPAFNAELPALAASKTSAYSPVIVVDQYTDFFPATMTTDGVHPNAIGNSQIAERWFATLTPLLNIFFAVSP